MTHTAQSTFEYIIAGIWLIRNRKNIGQVGASDEITDIEARELKPEERVLGRVFDYLKEVS